MQSDKRKAQRKPLRYSAWIAVEGQEKRGCVLSDISDSGARIEVENPQTLPDNFILLLAANNAPKRICKVIWREDAEVGVHFEKRHAPVPDKPVRRGRRAEDTPSLVPEAQEPAAQQPAAAEPAAAEASEKN